jgi:Transposase IS4
LAAKWLQILCAINDYNHYMNGVDRANQLRRNFTAHRAYERRVWRPLWYYILDVCAVNGYLVWKGDTEDKSKKGQRPFRSALAEALLNTPYATSNHGNYQAMPLINENAQNHHWEQFPKRGYCVWCKKQAETFKIRPVLAEIVNGAAPTGRKRSARSQGGCKGCNVYLCKKGACFKQYHSNSNHK